EYDAGAYLRAVASARLTVTQFSLGGFASSALPRRFALSYSVFDSLNNLLTEAEFDAACRNVLRHLAPGGVFVFDANTELALRELWAGGKVEGWADDVY